jgi:uncharacterized protein YuzE
MEEFVMEGFKVFYDDQEDILYLGREGQEEEVVELSPNVNMELDKAGNLIGVEVFQASQLFKDVIKQMDKKLQAA